MTKLVVGPVVVSGVPSRVVVASHEVGEFIAALGSARLDYTVVF